MGILRVRHGAMDFPQGLQQDQPASGSPALILFFRQYAPLSTYFCAHHFSPARSSLDNLRTTFAGAPRTTEPGGIFVPCVTSAFAPIMDCLPMTAPSKITAPMPTRHSSPTLHA